MSTDVHATPTMRRWRIALIAVGLGLLAIGGLVFLLDVDAKNYIGVLSWFAGAIIIHDGVAALVIVGVQLVLRRIGVGGRSIPFGVIAIVQGAIVLGVIVALVVFPEVLKQGIGSANPTLLPLDYGRNLLFFYAGLIAATALAIGVYLRVRASRQKVREPLVADDAAVDSTTHH